MYRAFRSFWSEGFHTIVRHRLDGMSSKGMKIRRSIVFLSALERFEGRVQLAEDVFR
jgi:hypothetical protein